VWGLSTPFTPGTSTLAVLARVLLLAATKKDTALLYRASDRRAARWAGGQPRAAVPIRLSLAGELHVQAFAICGGCGENE
jgi:hypothetical protein